MARKGRKHDKDHVRKAAPTKEELEWQETKAAWLEAHAPRALAIESFFMPSQSKPKWLKAIESDKEAKEQ